LACGRDHTNIVSILLDNGALPTPATDAIKNKWLYIFFWSILWARPLCWLTLLVSCPDHLLLHIFNILLS